LFSFIDEREKMLVQLKNENERHKAMCKKPMACTEDKEETADFYGFWTFEIRFTLMYVLFILD
jgi:hypothetical protein